MSSTPHSVKDHQIDKVMESRSQSSQILMNGIIEEKCKSKVDVNDRRGSGAESVRLNSVIGGVVK